MSQEVVETSPDVQLESNADSQKVQSQDKTANPREASVEDSERSQTESPQTPQQRPKSWGELSQSYIDNVTGAMTSAALSTYQTVKEVGKVCQLFLRMIESVRLL
jgi:hypothetical protein